MKLNAWFKGLIMALVGFVATTISTSVGGNVDWVYVLFASLGFLVVYVAKNAIWPSTSPTGELDVWDIVSGILLAVGMAVSSGATSFVLDGVVNWHALWIAVVGAFLGYFSKTIPQDKKV
jgi:hypothetical protein